MYINFYFHNFNSIVIVRDDTLRKKYQHELLSHADLDIVGDLIKLLKPFQELTLLISASEYVTSSIVLPAVTRLMEVLMLYEASNGTTFLETLAVDMHDDLNRRTKTYFDNNLLLTATYLDPRYRSLSFIKDEYTRNKALFDASSYIKTLSRKYW